MTASPNPRDSRDDWRTRTAPALHLVILALCAPAAWAGDSWPQFRGPDGQGRADDVDLPLTWSEEQGIRWKAPLPGKGWSSPVVADGRIWVTTAETMEPTPLERAELLKAIADNAMADQLSPVSSVTLSAIEIDLATGGVLRQINLFQIDAPPPVHGLNSYASPTPALSEGRLVCHFGTMGTACVDVKTGQVLWRKKFAINHIVGPGSSPIIHRGLAILTCDGGDEQYIVALDAATGETVWRRSRPPIRTTNPDMRKAFSTPVVIATPTGDQMVVPGAQWFIAYEPTTGEEIWRVDHGSGFSNVPAAVYDGGFVFLDTGYVKPSLWAVRVDGAGDVTQSHVQWRQGQQIPAKSSPAAADGRVYLISDGGVASCLDAQTGQPMWRERVPGQYSASPLLGAGRLYLCSQEGMTTVLTADSTFEILARNQLDGQIMASPAAIDGDLLLRTDSHLYRISRKP